MNEFFDWYVSTFRVQVQEGVYLAKSEIDDPNSGYGLYMDKTLIKDNKEDNKETIPTISQPLLKIPKEYTFNIHSILATINDKTLYPNNDVYDRSSKKIKEVFKSFLENSNMSDIFSETILLTFYFILFYYLQEDYNVPELCVKYLHDILISTEVNNPITRPKFYLQSYSHYPNIIANTMVVDMFTSFFEFELDIDSTTGKDVIRQIYAAITSRVLEIPHEISKDSEDFTTNTTLVPILDFVNHSSVSPCCAFDIDRSTGEVTLKLRDSFEEQTSKTRMELFIQYSDIVEYTSFNFTYGFIPEVKKSTPCYFNLSIERNCIPKQYRKFYKWFSVNPVMQFCKDKEKDSWFINTTLEEYEELLLPFMTDSSLKDEEIWSYNNNAYRSFANFYSVMDKDRNVADLNKICKNEITRREQSKNDVIGLPQFAWTLRFKDRNGKLMKRRVNKQKALENFRSLSTEDQESTCKVFEIFLQNYIGERLKKLEDIVNNNSEKVILDDNKNECQSFIDLCNIEIQILNQVISTDLTSLLSITTPIQQELEVVPLPPLINLYEEEEEEEEGIVKVNDDNEINIIDECQELSLHDYNELDYTDFVTQEQEEFSHYFL
ncbi:similar to Saccharomyces cerevisiae YHR109W CTM1 Cytochrome c lysine methyltransferase, trimethylates residue 72 of apo-cytochrome c (Cyc1p) in the cytosol [Maudiozyma saulgeensis]|uniref:Similar to Saccharomyces cerevisiae YHR109W CTM1 Cytochrome c lysine methyltransferase, trimethylates residue 72 of apo-cytochrome c (Cyc1p) in the cytosol n=1 Tax=Maudiozyma saulgeensis TaxID=1789683 RepID=A0A1X7QY42_9SACH|nr:similar to Saccharomyces cerevisiae YHR109W CTM1 Cytochrome c lysine methyltransferase, trimethylates residue 72 of apo-cytochrome c (Cyc1p) in the cytosol [Kazachstania saulgeensis]